MACEARQTNPWRYRVNVWVVCRINRARGVGAYAPAAFHSASREKTVHKNLLERAASFYSPIFPPLLDPASKPLLHYIPGTNVCGFFLVSAFTGIAVGVSAFSLRHFVPSDTAANTPARGRYFPSHSLVGTALQQVATSLMLRIHPLSNASPVGANSSTPVGVLRETLLTRKAFARRHPLIGGILACPVMRTWHENAPFATQIVVHACASPTDFKIRFGNTHLTIMRLASSPWLTFLPKSCSQRWRRHYQAHLFSILWQLKRRFHTWSNQKSVPCLSWFLVQKSDMQLSLFAQLCSLFCRLLSCIQK